MALLRKVKERFRRIIPAQKRVKKKQAARPHKSAKAPLARLGKKEAVLGTQELAVGKTKFSTPEPAFRQMPKVIQELPVGYGQDRIVLQVRDPWWLHTYWEVTAITWDGLHNYLGERFQHARVILRVYDISHINFDGKNAHRYFDIEVGLGSNSWYIDQVAPGRSWCVDIGLCLASGEFILIARSNTVYTPLEGPSWITDEEWMIPDDVFARLYGMGFGFGRSSPVGKAWQERMRRALFSGALASPGMASMASPVKKVPRQRQFWLKVDTELIVYGATEPDAALKVQGRQINLRPDGTFTLRFALPDGKQVIPVEATSADKLETRTITPIVTKETI
jgi:hypothetical protein